jgi:hypothetical protein
MLTHSQAARRKARAWQLGAVALLACAGAALALPIGRLLSPTVRTAPPAPPKAPEAQAQAPVDVNAVLDVLPSVAVRPTPPAPPPAAEAPPETVAVAEAPPQPAGEWVYIGSIITPRTRHATVRVGSEQHILGVGASVGDTTLTAVEPDHIEVETGGVSRRIDLPARTSASLVPVEGPRFPVTFRTPPVIGAAMPGGVPGAVPPGMPGARAAGASSFDGFRSGAMSPEQARILADARARAEHMRAAAGAQPQNVPERPDVDPNLSAELAKTLLTTDADPSARKDAVLKAGITPGMSNTEIDAVARQHGIDPSNEVFRTNVEQVIGRPFDPTGPQEAPPGVDPAEYAKLLEAQRNARALELNEKSAKKEK